MKFLEANNLDLQYFYDNDAAGFEKTETKLKEGYPVFLWKKLFQDIVDKKQSDDPYILLHRISKVKDLNKSRVPIIVFDKKLEQFKDKVLFPKKLEKANEILSKVGLPKV